MRAMALRPIIILPDKKLRTKSAAVGKITPDIRKLVEDMFETMYDAPGIGLAAIQVGVAKRVVTMDLMQGQERREQENRASSSIRKSLGRRTRNRPTRKAACRSRKFMRTSTGRRA